MFFFSEFLCDVFGPDNDSTNKECLSMVPFNLSFLFKILLFFLNLMHTDFAIWPILVMTCFINISCWFFSFSARNGGQKLRKYFYRTWYQWSCYNWFVTFYFTSISHGFFFSYKHHCQNHKHLQVNGKVYHVISITYSLNCKFLTFKSIPQPDLKFYYVYNI